MRSSPSRGIDVFDFDEDDEVSQSLAGKYSGKLKSPSSDHHALSTRDSLEFVASETKVQSMEISNVPCVVVAVDDCEPICGNATLLTSLDKAKDSTVSVNKCYNNSLQEKPPSHDQFSDFKSDHDEARDLVSEAEERCSELKASCLVKLQLNCDKSDSSSESDPIDATSDVDDSMGRNSSPCPASGMAEDNDLLNGCAMDHCSDDMEMEGVNTTVVLYPDYAIYRDTYCTEPQMIFSDSCIKIIGSTTYDQENFDFECKLDDVINIECQLFQRVETVMIKLRVIAKDVFEDTGTLSTSGIEELKIFVVEPNWCKKQEEIVSLHNRYLTLWKHVLDTDMDVGTDGEDSPIPRRYFPVFEESFEEVIYPKGDADAVSISKRDVDLLQPETFINDTIIDFYIKYLKNQIQPEERHKYHFFNSFFFRKLADMDKDPSSASDGTAAFQRVRKWTRKVDLFGKEFVFIPINFSLHWSLVVLCHPGEVATFSDKDLDNSHKVPCILHMDSIKGNHAGLKHLIQSYLWEEWKERKKETSEEVSSRFLNQRFVSLELPQQENSFDCGLFLLHYLERFVAEVPDNFSPFKIEKSSNFLNSNWFPPTEASLKRALIQRLIFELLKNRSQEISSPDSSDDELIPESNVNGGAQFLSASFNPGPSCQQNNLSIPPASQGIELTLLSPSSLRNTHCVNDSGLVAMDLFNPGGSAGSSMEQCQSFDQKATNFHLNRAMSTLEEDPETGEQFMFGDTEFHQLQLITPQTGGIPYPLKEYGTDAFGMGISIQTDHEDASDDSSDVVAIRETFPNVEHSSPSRKEKNEFECVEYVERGLTFASHELADCRSPRLENFNVFKESVVLVSDVEASQNYDMSQSGNEDGFSFPSLEHRDVLVGTQDSVVAESDVEMIEDDDNKAGLNSYEQQPRDDNPICLGDTVQSMEDGLLSLGPVGGATTGLGDNTQIVDGNELVGLESPRQNQVDNQKMVVDGSVVGQQNVDIEIGLGDNTQIVVEYDSVSLNSLAHKPLSSEMGLGGNTQIVEECDLSSLNSPGHKPASTETGFGVNTENIEEYGYGLVGLNSPGQKTASTETGWPDNPPIVKEFDSVGLATHGPKRVDNVIGSVDDDSEIFEDASAGLDSPRQKPVDNVMGSGENSQNFEDALVGLDSPGQKSVDNGMVFEDAPIELVSIHVIEDGFVCPDSPGQHPAKRQRLLPNIVEDETNTVRSAAED